MSLSTQLKATAESLIEKFGTTATLNRKSARALTGKASEPLQQDAPTTTVKVVDYSERNRDSQGLTGETRRRLLISTDAGVTPVKGDSVTIDGAEHEISEVRPITLQGTSLTWECDLVT